MAVRKKAPQVKPPKVVPGTNVGWPKGHPYAPDGDLPQDALKTFREKVIKARDQGVRVDQVLSDEERAARNTLAKRWPKEVPYGPVGDLTPDEKRTLQGTLMEQRAQRGAVRAGTKLEKKWVEYLAKKYRFVFVQAPLRAAGGKVVWADVLFGDDLNDLTAADSKRTPWTGKSSVQTKAYPIIGQKGGEVMLHEMENVSDEAVRAAKATGKPAMVTLGQAGRRAKVLPKQMHMLFEEDLAAAFRGKADLKEVLPERKVPQPWWRRRKWPKGSGITVADRLGQPSGFMKSRRRPPIAKRIGAALNRDRIMSGLRKAGGVAKFAGKKLTTLSIKGLKSFGRFAFRMILPPFTPWSLLFDVVTEVVFALIERYYEKKEMENFQKQLDRLPPMIEKLIAVPANKEAAAALLIASAGRRGPGFVYATITATVTRKFTQRGMISPDDQWDISLDLLEWDEYFYEARSKEPEVTEDLKFSSPVPGVHVPSYHTTKKTVVIFTIEEPIFTPFDYLLGAFGTLEDAMVEVYHDQTGVPGGVGPIHGKADSKFLERYGVIAGWIQRYLHVLSYHRSAEEMVGTHQVGEVRRIMIKDGLRMLKSLQEMIRTLVPSDVWTDYDPMSGPFTITNEILEFLFWANQSEHKGYYPRGDKALPAKMSVGDFWRKVGWKGGVVGG